MTPPITGIGISVAFEGAGMAVGPLAAYSRSELNWREAQRQIAAACDAAFARQLHTAMIASALQGTVGALALSSGWLWRATLTATRK